MLVLGTTGTGKSTRAKKLAAGWIRMGQSVVVFDPGGEWAQRSKKRRITPGPCSNVCSPDELSKITSIPDGGLAVQPADGIEESDLVDGLKTLDQWLRTTQSDSPDDVVLIIDEVGLIEQQAQRTIKRLAIFSRHDGIALVLIAQRATSIDKTARSQMSWVVSGSQVEVDDVDALNRIDPTARIGDRVRGLHGFECAVWKRGSGILERNV